MLAAIIVSVATSWYLVGLTWVVDLVVYPAFSLVGPGELQRYHQSHRRSITFAVGPVWLVQGVAIAAWVFSGSSLTEPWAIATGCLAAAAVGVTIVKAVPAHDSLAERFDPPMFRRLLFWHRVRSLTWTVCAIVAAIGLAEAASG